jgi:hypothetical protein
MASSRAELSQRKPYNPKWWSFTVSAALVVILASIITTVAWNSSDYRYYGCVVEDKDRVAGVGSAPPMRVYTTCGVFSMGDNIWSLTFDAAEIYADIHIGVTYEIHTVGWHASLLGQYPLIINVREEKE